MKTPAERKRDERGRMRARGFVLRQFWVHPKDWPRIERYLRLRLNQREMISAGMRYEHKQPSH